MNQTRLYIDRHRSRQHRPVTIGFKDPTSGTIARFDDLSLRIDRLARLQAELRRANYSAALFFDPINIRYATGTRNMSVWLLHNLARYCFIPVEGKPTLFEFPNANCQTNAQGNEILAEVRAATAHLYTMAYEHRDSLASKWASEILDMLLSVDVSNPRLAVDRLDPTGFHSLLAVGIQLGDGLEIAERARLIKSANEIKLMHDAVCVAEAGVNTIQKMLRPGLTENQAFAELSRINLEAGGEWIESRLLTAGGHTNPWFQESSNQAIEAGDIVSLDTDLIGPSGYCADISRSFVCGPTKPVGRQQDLYRLAHEQVTWNLALLGPGVSFKALAEKAWRIPERFRRQYYGMLAHGVGLADEGPVISYDSHDPLAPAGELLPGMCISVESYIGEVGAAEGIKLEEQVIITEKGCELLGETALPEQLISYG